MLRAIHAKDDSLMTMDNMTLILAQDAAPDRPLAPDNSSGTDTIQTTQTPGGTPLDGGADGSTPKRSSDFSMIYLLLPLALVFIMLSMGGRKEKKKRAKMMAAMGKGDKVQTVGGILGTVVEMRDDEIVVKVDENANTRLRFSRTAIQTILESKNAE
jgi:preprotein translocase subunit YajC